jgi:hypothetical protein
MVPPSRRWLGARLPNQGIPDDRMISDLVEMLDRQHSFMDAQKDDLGLLRHLRRYVATISRDARVSGDQKARVSGVRPRFSYRGVMPSAGLHAPSPL